MCYDVMNIPYLSHNTSLLQVQVLVPAFTSLSAITWSRSRSEQVYILHHHPAAVQWIGFRNQ